MGILPMFITGETPVPRRVRLQGARATPIETINVGFGNVVSAARIVVVARAGSSPIRRLIDAAERENRLVDATSGRRTRSIIVTDSNHVVLSHVQPRTLAQKMAGVELPDDLDADEPDDDEP